MKAPLQTPLKDPGRKRGLKESRLKEPSQIQSRDAYARAHTRTHTHTHTHTRADRESPELSLWQRLDRYRQSYISLVTNHCHRLLSHRICLTSHRLSKDRTEMSWQVEPLTASKHRCSLHEDSLPSSASEVSPSQLFSLCLSGPWPTEPAPPSGVPRKPTSAMASDAGGSVHKEGVGVGDAPKTSSRS